MYFENLYFMCVTYLILETCILCATSWTSIYTLYFKHTIFFHRFYMSSSNLLVGFSKESILIILPWISSLSELETSISLFWGRNTLNPLELWKIFKHLNLIILNNYISFVIIKTRNRWLQLWANISFVRNRTKNT